LRPLVEPGGTLTGQSGQLIVRASPGNIEDLRRALDAIDRPSRRLQISVRFDSALDASNRSVEASGRISERGARVDVRAQDARTTASDRVHQRVQVMEGGRAFIATGQSRTLPQRQVIRTPGGVVAQETMEVQEIATGFEVSPRLSGGTVLLDIRPQRETPGAFAGSVDSQRASSTVSARLGEWIELGGTTGSLSRDDRGLASAGRVQTSDTRRIWVKVEETGN
jgi:hypothetical protein